MLKTLLLAICVAALPAAPCLAGFVGFRRGDSNGDGNVDLSDGITTLTYQGQLSNAAGEPITANHNMTFRLYSSSDAEEPVWTELHESVGVIDGGFRVLLPAAFELALYEFPPRATPS